MIHNYILNIICQELFNVNKNKINSMIYNKKTLKTGWYHVVNTDKFKNKNNTKLYYRSGLEKRFAEICDHSKNISEWKYEEHIIPYKKTYGDGKTNFYIIDFWLKKKMSNGEVKEFLVEIKPYDFLTPPKNPKRKTKRYLELLENYSKNVSKWSYANEYAKQNGMEFAIITEKDL